METCRIKTYLILLLDLTLSIFRFIRLKFIIYTGLALFLLPTFTLGQEKEFYKVHESYRFNPNRKLYNSNSSQTDSVFTVLGRWAKGFCFAIDVLGNRAYLGNGETLQVFDVTNPASPHELGEIITNGIIEDIKIKGDYAFVCCWDGLKIINVSKPESPKIIYSTPPEIGIAFQVEVMDTLALFCAGSGYGVISIDIRDINHPEILGNFAMMAQFITIEGHYVYAAFHMSAAVTIIDFANPASPSYMGSIDISPNGYLWELAVIDNYLYVCTDLPNALKIYDLATPTNPTLVNSVGYSITAKIAYDSNYIYMTVNDSNGICIFDKSDPSNPKIVGKVNALGWQMVPSNGNLYLASIDAFQVVDLQNVDSAKVLFHYPAAGGAEKIRIKDNFVFIATRYDGLWILNMANPTTPKPVMNLNPGWGSLNIMLDDNYAYIINQSSMPLCGLWIVDITDLYNPEVLSYHVGIAGNGCSFPVSQIAKSGNYLFVTQGGSPQNDSTLEIVNVANPSSPTTASIYRSPYEPWDVAVKDSIIYLATKYGGLRIINYSNPTAPFEIGSLFNTTYRLSKSGNNLFVAASDSIYILDISHPAEPVIAGSAAPGGLNYSDMAASGKFLYCTFWGGLYLFDISNPRNVVLKDILTVTGPDDEHNESSVTLASDFVIMSHPERGIWTIQNKLDTAHISRLQVSTGWNLLSVPTGAIDKKRFINDIMVGSGATSPAYTYNSFSYVISDSIVDGNGFWMKFDTSHDVKCYGSPLQTAAIEIHKGWNMIGSLGDPLPTILTRTQPSGIISSNYFGYNDQYKSTDTLYPGKGYWVKASQPGEMIFSFQPLIIPNIIQPLEKRNPKALIESLNTIELGDLDGHKQTLYFGSGIRNDIIEKYELPPPVPPGDFDGRFVNGSMIATIEPDDSTKQAIALSSSKYPVTLSWNIKSQDIIYLITIDGKEITLSKTGTIQIDRPSYPLKVRSQINHSMSNKFSLDQNYPNPFNGTTIIKYSVPKITQSGGEKHNVSIKVYNSIGQEMAVLLNEEKQPGNYSLAWNPKHISTGVYYYRLESNGIRIVKPGLYIK